MHLKEPQSYKGTLSFLTYIILTLREEFIKSIQQLGRLYGSIIYTASAVLVKHMLTWPK